jgi:hypothetical protein
MMRKNKASPVEDPPDRSTAARMAVRASAMRRARKKCDRNICGLPVIFLSA